MIILKEANSKKSQIRAPDDNKEESIGNTLHLLCGVFRAFIENFAII
jgi:hypothetical protein